MKKQLLGALIATALALTACSTPTANPPTPEPAGNASATPNPASPGPQASTSVPQGSTTVPQGSVTLRPLSTHGFTIAIPESWKIQTQSESGDQVILADPAEPGVFIAVFSFQQASASKEFMSGHWQFKDRNPQPFTSPSGREGIIAQGPLGNDPTKSVLAAGYWEPKWWEQTAQATAPVDQFGAKKPLFEAILKTFEPKGVGDKPPAARTAPTEPAPTEPAAGDVDGDRKTDRVTIQAKDVIVTSAAGTELLRYTVPRDVLVILTKIIDLGAPRPSLVVYWYQPEMKAIVFDYDRVADKLVEVGSIGGLNLGFDAKRVTVCSPQPCQTLLYFTYQNGKWVHGSEPVGK